MKRGLSNEFKSGTSYIFEGHTFCLSSKMVNLKRTSKNDRTACLKRILKNIETRLKRSVKNKKAKQGNKKNLKIKNLINTIAGDLKEILRGIGLELLRHVKRTKKMFPKGQEFCIYTIFPVVIDELIKPLLKLPHRARLQRWKLSVSCSPRFLSSMLNLASPKSTSHKESNVLEEMSLRKKCRVGT